MKAWQGDMAQLLLGRDQLRTGCGVQLMLDLMECA